MSEAGPAGPRAGQAGTIVEVHEDAYEVELNDAGVG